MASKLPFAVGDKILCFHGPQLYEARVEDAKALKEGPEYLVHYSGWKKSWDEWVPESRVLKYNDSNLAKQQELAAFHGGKKQGKKSTKLKRSAKEDAEGKASKRPRGSKPRQEIQSESDFANRPEVKVVLPDDLKHKLIDDWDKITKQKKLVKLPAKVTVSAILKEFLAQTKAKTAHIAPEVVAGLKVYFEQALGSLLLYNFERPQYEEYLAEHAEPQWSDVYGAEHLLRLFVKLPMLLAHTTLDERGMHQLVSGLHDVLKFMQKNGEKFFSDGQYHSASADYVSRASSGKK